MHLAQSAPLGASTVLATLLMACGGTFSPQLGDADTADQCVPACTGGLVCDDGHCVADDPCQSVSCDPGTVCRGGVCVTSDPDVDLDGDGFLASDDCDDADRFVFPGATEECNDRDDDCDDAVDEGDACHAASCEISFDREVACDGAAVTVTWESSAEDCTLACSGQEPSAVECNSSQVLTGAGALGCVLTVGIGSATTSCEASIDAGLTPSCTLAFTPSTIAVDQDATATWTIENGEQCQVSCTPPVALIPTARLACNTLPSFPIPLSGVDVTTTCTINVYGICGEGSCTQTLTVR